VLNLNTSLKSLVTCWVQHAIKFSGALVRHATNLWCASQTRHNFVACQSDMPLNFIERPTPVQLSLFSPTTNFPSLSLYSLSLSHLLLSCPAQTPATHNCQRPPTPSTLGRPRPLTPSICKVSDSVFSFFFFLFFFI
jgi:hypothetical protein